MDARGITRLFFKRAYNNFRDFCLWMVCNFTSFSTVFQPYQDNGILIMESCVLSCKEKELKLKWPIWLQEQPIWLLKWAGKENESYWTAYQRINTTLVKHVVNGFIFMCSLFHTF